MSQVSATLARNAQPRAMNMDTTSSDPLAQPSVQEHIQTLTDVHNRLQRLRHVPTLLLRPALADFPPSFDREFGATFHSTPTHDLVALREFVGVLCSNKVQEALQAARASEEADQSELLSCQRERKRKRPRSPVGSPQPYVPSPPRSSSLFASPEDEPAPLRTESLTEFVREFNRGGADGSGCRLAIWTRTRTTSLTSPVVLRFVIPDVLTAYMSLIFANAEHPLVVESVAAFGPRERKLPHEQSDYLVFQELSQHIAKMLLSHPRVPVQVLMNVLVSYRGLFVERCGVCQRVLSAEGHVPPVGRVWVGQWEARHGVCMSDG